MVGMLEFMSNPDLVRKMSKDVIDNRTVKEKHAEIAKANALAKAEAEGVLGLSGEIPVPKEVVKEKRDKHGILAEGDKEKPSEYSNLFGGYEMKAFDDKGLAWKFNNEYLPLYNKYMKLPKILRGDMENPLVRKYMKQDKAYKYLIQDKKYLKMNPRTGKMEGDLKAIKKGMADIEENLKVADLLYGKDSTVNARKILKSANDYGKGTGLNFKVASTFRDQIGHNLGWKHAGKKPSKKRKGPSTHGSKEDHTHGASAVDISKVEVDGDVLGWPQFIKNHPEKYRHFVNHMLQLGYSYINEKGKHHGHFSVNPKFAGTVRKRVGNTSTVLSQVGDSAHKYKPNPEDIGLGVLSLSEKKEKEIERQQDKLKNEEWNQGATLKRLLGL